MKLRETQANAVQKLKTIDRECEIFWNDQMDLPKFIKGTLSRPSNEDPEIIARKFLGDNQDLLDMDDGLNEVLEVSHIETDKQGFRHVFLGQKINGLPVFEGSVQVHLNSQGEVIAYKDNRITGLDISLTPRITEKMAQDTVLNDADSETDKFELQSDLSLFRDQEKRLHLAWEIELHIEDDLGGIYYFVDAHSGQLLFKYSQIREALSRLTYTAENTSILKRELILRDNQTTQDMVAQAAHDHAATVYEYFSETFGRDSYDDQGAPLVSTVHFRENYNNAFWSDWNKQMVYGDGDGVRWRPLALALDIVGHELTHAVTSSTARFIYAEEAGALDESFADFFGVMITNDDTIVDWEMGEGVYTPFKDGDALRDFSDPPKYGQPDHMDTFIHLEPGELPDPDKNDNGYVHYNSGIPNKVAYLITAGGTHHGITVNGIGRTRAEQIYYLALTVYLSSSTRSRWTFQQARYALLNACRQIYGDTGEEYTTVKNAWAAVGIGDPAEDFTTIHKEISPNLPIPDRRPAGVQSVLHVPDNGLLKSITIRLAIRHTYIGDLRVTLVSPAGEFVVLHNRTGRSENDIEKTYDINSTPSLMTFMGDQIQGDWILKVSDHARYDTGRLIKWEMDLTTQVAEKKTLSKETSPGISIPDNNNQGIESVMLIDKPGKIVNLDVSIDVSHTWIGDLKVILILPSGDEVPLHNRTGRSRDNITKTYSTKTDDFMQTLIGKEINGEWKLQITDHAQEDTGRLNKWQLDFIYE